MNDQTTISQMSIDVIFARFERTIKRLWILCIILIITLLATNAGWVIYESQFTTTEVKQEVDTGNGDTMVIGVGDYNNGESTTDR